MKKFVSLLAAATLSLGVLTVDAMPAQAIPGGSCSIAMPSTLVITNPYTRFSIPLAADCSANGADYAAWYLTNARTGALNDVMIYDTDMSPQLLAWYDDYNGFGTFILDPGASWDYGYNDLTQNTTTVVVKAASKASQLATRNRSTVVITAGASYYNARLNRQIPWNQASLQIQSSNSLTGRWTTVATVTTGSDGRATKSIYAPSARFWRVLTPTTASVFNRYSVPVYR